jgi:hypothetical protein
MKPRLMPFSFLAVLLAHAPGCSLYLNQPVTFHVRDAETKQAIEGAEIQTHYSTMMDFGLLFADWGPREGVTDTEGKVTLFFDPRKEYLTIDATAKGYHSQPNMWGSEIRKRLVARHGLAWGSDFVLEMYKNPDGQLDLIAPDGYRGVVLIRFAAIDSPPQPIGQRHFTYELGHDGQVTIRESGLFERAGGYGRVNARFRDGTDVPKVEDRSGTGVPPGSLALRFITPVWEHHTWVYVLGTKAEADAVDKALWGDGDHFNESVFKRLSGLP